MAKIGLQAIRVEPMQSGRVPWLETHDELSGGAVRQAHPDAILPVDDPEDAAMDGDLRDIPARIGKARFWPFRAGGIGPDGQDPAAKKIEDEDQRAKPDREPPEQAAEGAQGT